MERKENSGEPFKIYIAQMSDEGKKSLDDFLNALRNDLISLSETWTSERLSLPLSDCDEFLEEFKIENPEIGALQRNEKGEIFGIGFPENTHGESLLQLHVFVAKPNPTNDEMTTMHLKCEKKIHLQKTQKDKKRFEILRYVMTLGLYILKDIYDAYVGDEFDKLKKEVCYTNLNNGVNQPQTVIVMQHIAKELFGDALKRRGVVFEEIKSCGLEQLS